jgi:hypothetical protein
VTEIRRALVFAATLVAIVAGVARPAAAQPAGDAADLRPGEIQRLFDAYLVMEAQQTLGLSDDQYAPFLRGCARCRRCGGGTGRSARGCWASSAACRHRGPRPMRWR